jgi:hypothetical protein
MIYIRPGKDERLQEDDKSLEHETCKGQSTEREQKCAWPRAVIDL